jgi:hypothetical protein
MSEVRPANSFMSDPTNHPIVVRSVLLKPPAASRKVFYLATLALMSIACILPAHGQSTIETPGGVPPSPPAVNDAPRNASGHPSTLWDKQNVTTYRASLTTDKALAAAFNELQAWGNKRISEPISVPAYRVDADGNWTFPDFKRGYRDASGKWNWEWLFNAALQKRAEDVSNLGMLYALTGNEKYATFATQILLAAADAYGYGKGSSAPDPHGYDHWEAYGFDGGDLGMFLAKACHGYDLIYNASSAKDRTRIERDLIRPLAEHLKKSAFMYTTHDRWGMVCLYGLFIAGETLNDPALINLALFGQGGTSEKVTGGFMDCFKPGFLRDGAIWGAGPKIDDDQIAAVSVMTAVAEVMWHHGVDLYGYQNSTLKKSFEAALKSVGTYNASTLNSLPGIDAYPYAFHRYHDERYLPVIRQLTPGFTLAIGEHLPTLPAPELTTK